MVVNYRGPKRGKARQHCVAGENRGDTIIISYKAERESEPPHVYWTVIEMGRDTIFATGATLDELGEEIIISAVLLGYEESAIVLNHLNPILS